MADGCSADKNLDVFTQSFRLDQLERFPLHVHRRRQQCGKADDLRLVAAYRGDEILFSDHLMLAFRLPRFSRDCSALVNVRGMALLFAGDLFPR